LPITRFELLVGKFVGLAGALAAATVGGFGLAGVLIFTKIGSVALYHYGGFIVSALLLGLAFLSLAVLVSVLAQDRMRASGVAIALWFFYVLIYDLLLLGLMVVSEGRIDAALFPVLLVLNPADIFRILNIFSLEDLKAFYGLATVFPAGLSNPWLLGGMMVAWIVMPLAVALWRFR
jgi:Cu-processing system permease protein